MASVTIWSRLEPRTRELGMSRGLQAQMRDPAWMLARQWQLGEFLGDDGGSPISATVRTESLPVTSFRPAGGAAEDAGDAVPLETRVERDTIQAGLGDSVSLGVRFEELLDDEGAGGHVQHFRDAFPIAPDPPDDELLDARARAVRRLAAGRVVDGAGLVAAARAHAGDPSTFAPVASLPHADRAPAARAVARLVALRVSALTEPGGDTSWQPQHLEHSFSVGAAAQGESVVLDAPHFRGGHVDWHAFSLGSGELRPGTGQPEVREQAFIPNLVTFRGMPSPRWWEFEDGLTDFGRLDAQAVDLAKLVVMEFALVYGHDWFELPLPLAGGSLSRVETLVVSDTFGFRTVVEPTGRQVPAGQRPWSMFSLTGADPAADLLFLVPALADVLEGPVVEDVFFVRDEMAAMGWAIEAVLEGTLNRPVDGYDAYRARLAASPPTPPRTRDPDGPPIEYVLGTDVPDNWIPMVPVQLADGSLRLRRGILGGPGARGARGTILEPDQPFYVADEAVPREGVTVTRRYRRTRWTDGSTLLWVARRAEVGRGEAASGLAFDVVRDLPAEAP